MSIVQKEHGTLVHYPNNPDMFEFDGEVAELFDNMAVRSIPHYAISHKLNAHISKKYMDYLISDGAEVQVCDVGASTGGFLRELYDEYRISYDDSLPNTKLYATDISRPMLDRVSRVMPNVLTYEQDVLSMASMGIKFNIINASYVVQFLKPNRQPTALSEIRQSMNHGGLLFISHKELVGIAYDDLFQNRYITFRKENGYSDAEIEAKTKALKNAMFPCTRHVLVKMLESAGFCEIQETSRWLQFSSFVAIAG